MGKKNRVMAFFNVVCIALCIYVFTVPALQSHWLLFIGAAGLIWYTMSVIEEERKRIALIKSEPLMEGGITVRGPIRMKIERQHTEKDCHVFIQQAAVLLSDNNESVLERLATYETNDWSWHKELASLTKAEKEQVSYFDFMIIVLEEVGFVGTNDWKFSLADFIYNSKKALDYYGIDPAIYKEVTNKETVVAPEAFQELKRYLPFVYGVGVLLDDSDTYNVVIGPQSKLLKAQELLRKAGENLYIVELGVVEEI